MKNDTLLLGLLYAYMYTYVYTYIHICICMCVHIHTHICMYTYICANVYMYICRCIYYLLYFDICIKICISLLIHILASLHQTVLTANCAYGCIPWFQTSGRLGFPRKGRPEWFRRPFAGGLLGIFTCFSSPINPSHKFVSRFTPTRKNDR